MTPLADLNAPFAVACGSGPTLTIDGIPYETSVSGTVGDFYALRTMPLAICTSGGTIALAPGTHTITADDARSGFKVTGLSLVGTPVQPSTCATHHKRRTLGRRVSVRSPRRGGRPHC